MGKLVGSLIVLGLVAGGVWYFSAPSPGAKPSYRTAKVDKGPLTISITATGALQAVTTVQVGTQISGIVQKLFVDFNDRVEAGQTVAQLDPNLLQVRLSQDKASLSRSEANLSRLQVDLVDAERKFQRQNELFQQKVASQNDLDTAQVAVETAKAQLQVAQAELLQAKAAVASSEINLRNATITSPISGIVISRSVDVGQTVAASLSAPTLFTIANDLSKMWVLANIDEADIGRVLPGQNATFSVDSFPDREFKAKVRQVRLQPTTVQNVVMYTVVLDVDNPDGLLLPGMTANLSLLVDRAETALRVPNAALRFQPSMSEAAPMESRESKAETKSPRERGGERGGERSGERGGARGPGNGHGKPADASAGKPARVYKLVNGALTPVEIRIGRSDGALTECLDGEIAEGDELVVGLQGAAPGGNAANAPGKSPWGMGGRR